MASWDFGMPCRSPITPPPSSLKSSTACSRRTPSESPRTIIVGAAMRRISSTGQANEVVSSCHSGATLVRPGLEALRDLAAQGCLDVVLCYSPDRLARKFAYQALLIEEFTRSRVRMEFIKGPRGDSPEDQLMVQFQGM